MTEIKSAIKTTALVLLTIYAFNQIPATQNLIRKALVG